MELWLWLLGLVGGVAVCGWVWLSVAGGCGCSLGWGWWTWVGCCVVTFQSP